MKIKLKANEMQIIIAALKYGHFKIKEQEDEKLILLTKLIDEYKRQRDYY